MKTFSPQNLKPGDEYAFNHGGRLCHRRVLRVRPSSIVTPAGIFPVTEVLHTTLTDEHPMTVNFAQGATVFC